MSLLGIKTFKQQPMWAHGLKRGDVFFYHPKQKTYVVLRSDVPTKDDPLGLRFTIAPYSILTEAYYHFTEYVFNAASIRVGRLLRSLRSRGFISHPKGVVPEFWPLVRTFTLNKRVRTSRVSEIEYHANSSIYWRDRVRSIKEELEYMHGDIPTHYFEPNDFSSSPSGNHSNP